MHFFSILPQAPAGHPKRSFDITPVVRRSTSLPGKSSARRTPIIAPRGGLMIRSEVRAQVAANQPDVARVSDGPGDQATKAAAAPPPQADRPSVAPGRGHPPWLVRNSRKATIGLVLAILAASPFAYLYLQREFGPDPLAGIKLDDVKVDAISGIPEVVKLPEVKPPDAKSAVMKPVPAAGAIELAPKLHPPRASASPARSTAAAPIAPSFGVTHTRPAVAAPAGPATAAPVAAIPDALGKSARPRASARDEQTGSGACAEAVAALGLCNSNATEKGR